MRTTRAMIALAMACVLALAGTACGSSGSSGSSDGESSATSEDASTPTSADDTGSGDDGGDSGDSSGTPSTGPLLAGTLTVDGEDIELNPGRCFLEEQPAAGGGGVIELTAQGTGTNRAGDPVTVDFTRYSADSDFAGDDVSITIGDPFEDPTELAGTADSGTVQVDGFEVSATDFEVSEDPTASQSVSFTINC